MLTPDQISTLKATQSMSSNTTQPMDSVSFANWANERTAPTTQVRKPGIIERVSENVKSSLGEAKNEIMGTGDYTGQNPFQRGAELAATATGAPFKASFAANPEALQNVYNKPTEAVSSFVNWLGDMIGGTKHAQDFVMKHPDAAKALENTAKTTGALAETAGNVALATGAGEIKGKDIIPNIKEGASATVKNFKEAGTSFKEAVTKSPIEIAAEQAKQAKIKTESFQKNAIKDATPSYNKKIIGENMVEGPNGKMIPRLSEPDTLNPTKPRTVNSSTSEIDAGKELTTVPGYQALIEKNATALDKANLVQNEIVTRAKALDASLEKENVLRPPKELNKLVKDATTKAGSESLLLQKADPAIKNYNRVANIAIKDSPGTLAGERKVVLKLDQAYEDAGGKYMNNKALDQIHRAARNALIDDMEAKAVSTEVKASLKSMKNLYNANDVLWEKAREEGGTKWEQFKKAHPIISKTAATVGRYTGLGEAIHLSQ